MENFVELILEVLFNRSKQNPEKMPDDIPYNPNFLIRYHTKKMTVKIVVSLIIIAIFSFLYFLINDSTRYLYLLFIILSAFLLILTIHAISFRCLVTEEYIKSSHWGLFVKHINWCKVSCIKVIEQTGEKSVIIAIYNDEGKCVIDLNTDMNNVWYIVKMAETKRIIIKQEKDLSLKQISRL